MLPICVTKIPKRPIKITDLECHIFAVILRETVLTRTKNAVVQGGAPMRVALPFEEFGTRDTDRGLGSSRKLTTYGLSYLDRKASFNRN